ncbi:hypothetical protein C1H46_009465 [Malus baccata]|uniref:Reverse transcriptase Ty1/copia-type domain-containing protein n=1 Tax=Malus baccata TaxID=106549 RepID=A0A540N1V2_MALBA|nr:hypothetical protein C1H46_009465 [Malus baccata]
METTTDLQATDPIDQQVDVQVHTETRRSTRMKKPAISSDFLCYLQETDYNFGDIDDLVTYSDAIKSSQSFLWNNAMKEELESMFKNQVWSLVEPKSHVKPIGCRWVYKTKRNACGQIERYKARLVAKGFTQREGIDYNDTFSPVSSKDSMRIIMAITAHFDLELHQMDVKTAFLNGDLQEDIYMCSPLDLLKRGKSIWFAN